MLIGIPREIKDNEYRVGATPEMVKVLKGRGHKLLVEKGAGKRIGYSDELYEEMGARMVDLPEEVYAAEMVIKVKEPQRSEYKLLREGQILFCFLHLAPDPQQTSALIESGCVAIAYETVTDDRGRLPLLVPMSEIAGKVAIHAAAVRMHLAQGGPGVLLGRVPGVVPAKVVVIGGGVVGTQSARMAMGLETDVTIIDIDVHRLRELDEIYRTRIKTKYSTPDAIAEEIVDADLVVGAVLVTGHKAPHIVTREMIGRMKQGALIVDVAIDQGGCCETSHPTTHSSPTYEVDGVVHYCVTNMPGACARTATQALTNVTMPYAIAIADNGFKKALSENPHLRHGLNICRGQCTYAPVAADLGLSYTPPEEVLATGHTS